MHETIGGSYEPLENKKVMEIDWKRVYSDLHQSLFIILFIVIMCLFSFSLLFSVPAINMVLYGKIIVKLLGILILTPLGLLVLLSIFVAIGLILYGFVSLYYHVRDKWIIEREIIENTEMENV
jgi:hypothetical protein